MFKTLNLLILRSYIGPLIVAFCIVMFILIMQFLWLYIDELMGKGLGTWLIIELVFYASANLVNMALPLSILFSSTMTFGNLAEYNELTALKASGNSLIRVMRPLIILMVFISGFAFYFSNNLWPVANFKMRVLLTDISKKKPAMTLKEGVFYNDIDGMSIRVMKKNDETGLLQDILIYDRSTTNSSYNKDFRDYKQVIRAEYGKMHRSPDNKGLVFELHNGEIYKEIEQNQLKDTKYPFQKSRFKHASFNLDLSSLDLKRSDENNYTTDQLLNVKQLDRNIDSLNKVARVIKENLTDYVSKTYATVRQRDKENYHPHERATAAFEDQPQVEQKKIIQKAITRCKNVKKHIEQQTKDALGYNEKYITTLKVEWHKKFTLSIACLILFFIGAPLGSIVKKGGFGYPMLFTIAFFILYYILTMIGQKIASNQVVVEYLGVWLSSFVLFPIGVFLTYKANNDSVLFDREFYLRILGLKKKVKDENSSAML